MTPREAAINLANCIMGAGALSLPSFFKSTGAVLGVALLLASCAWTWFSAVMMVKAADAVSVRVLEGVPVSSYEELMDLTLGRNGKRLSAVGILLLQIALVGYANILADVASPFAIGRLASRAGTEPRRRLGGRDPRCHAPDRRRRRRRRRQRRARGGVQSQHRHRRRVRASVVGDWIGEDGGARERVRRRLGYRRSEHGAFGGGFCPCFRWPSSRSARTPPSYP